MLELATDKLKRASDIDVNSLDPMDVRPVGHWILAEAIPKQDLSKGGIVLPDAVDTESAFWLVHQVGCGLVSGHTTEYMTDTMHQIERGDIVVAGSRGWGVAIKENREFVMLKIPDITGVIDGGGLA